MPFSWDDIPYTNFHELNLDWFIKKFKEIFDEWENLYNTMLTWKDTTDADLAEWKETVEHDMSEWEDALTAALDEWKGTTEQDISDWEAGVLSDLGDWKDGFETLFESTFSDLSDIKSAAEDARDAAIEAQGAAEDAADEAEAAAESISESLDDISQNSEDIIKLKNNVFNSFAPRITDYDGIVIPEEFELGAIAFASSVITYSDSNTAIRTPSNYIIRVSVGDKIHLTDYTSAHFKVAILRDSDSGYSYSTFRTTDYTVADEGRLYIVVSYQDSRTISSVSDLSNLVQILTNGGQKAIWNNNFNVLYNYYYLNDNLTFSNSLFGAGDLDSNYNLNRELRPYRIATVNPITFKYNIRIYSDSQHVFSVYTYADNIWTRINDNWCACVEIPANTKFAMDIRDVTEDSSATANVTTMLNSIYVEVDYIPFSRTQNINNIIYNGKFNKFLFSNGQLFAADNPYLNPMQRRFRITMYHPITLDKDISINANNGYEFILFEYLSNTWTRRGGTYGVQKNVVISKNVPFSIMILQSVEGSSDANIDTFISELTVFTEETIKNTDIVSVNDSIISDYMSLFYESDSAESYVFFTDPHLMGSGSTFDKLTFGNYINVLKATMDKTSASYVVCGGDWLNNGDTKAQASKKLGFVDGQMREVFPGIYYPIVGNHDFNYLGVDGEGTRLPEAEWIDNPAIHNFWFSCYQNCYYKFKVAVAQNYVLNTEMDYDGTDNYTKNMLDWFAGELISDNPAHATIFMHLIHLSTSTSDIPKRVAAVGAIISAFNAHEECTLTVATHGYEKTYDFTGTTGHIDYVMTGHSHEDYDESLGGVPAIATINMQANGTPSFDLVFADYSDSKVYLKRIGSGSSRIISLE